jgi:hypothetical protein
MQAAAGTAIAIIAANHPSAGKSEKNNVAIPNDAPIILLNKRKQRAGRPTRIRTTVRGLPKCSPLIATFSSQNNSRSNDARNLDRPTIVPA